MTDPDIRRTLPPAVVLGVDGGGTKTEYMLFDTKGNLIDCMRGGATNHECLAGGMAELEVLLNETILLFLGRNGLSPADLAASVFGMAGADVPKQRSALSAVLSRMGFGNFLVVNDAFLGVKAGIRQGCGICAVNGTGNTVAGIDRTGRILQVAGCGWVSGADGGAAAIALQALRSVYEEHFCLGPRTMMTPGVMRLLRIEDPENFIEALYDRYYTGDIAPKEILDVLFDCGNAGDKAATDILRRVGGQIARCIAGCSKRLNFGDELDVVLVGSVMLKASCPILLDELKAETAALAGKTVRFIPLDVPPAAGAVYWAMELALGREAAGAIWDSLMESSWRAFQ